MSDIGLARGLARGLWGVLATPLRGPGLEIDEASLRRQIEHHRTLGSRGVVALGVFGEAARLSGAERAQVAAAATQAANDSTAATTTTQRLPVVLGLPELATAQTIRAARELLSAAGPVAAIMVQINSADPAELRSHLTAVHDATGTALVVQDYPATSGVSIPAAALAAAIRGLDFVAAVKSEAPPTAVAIAGLTAQGVEAPVFGGLGGLGLLDELMAGAAGAMTGFSFPEGLLATLEAWEAGGYAAAREAYLPWLPLVNFEAQAGVGLAVRKASLQRRGLIDEAAVRPPGAPFPVALGPLLDRHLAALGTGNGTKTRGVGEAPRPIDTSGTFGDDDKPAQPLAEPAALPRSPSSDSLADPDQTPSAHRRSP